MGTSFLFVILPSPTQHPCGTLHATGPAPGPQAKCGYATNGQRKVKPELTAGTTAALATRRHFREQVPGKTPLRGGSEHY